MNTLLCIGMGFSARSLCRQLDPGNWSIIGTSTTPQGAGQIERAGYRAAVFDGSAPLDTALLSGVSHLLVSAPPSAQGDPALRSSMRVLEAVAPRLQWAAYLSTTGVYGDRGGEWVDEASPLLPTNERSKWRLKAEEGWLKLSEQHGLPLAILRLAGIYGPGRNQIRSMLEGNARRIVKAGQVFSRVHVDDIAGVLLCSMARPSGSVLLNVCDDEPAPPQDVVAYAAQLLGLPVPAAEDFATAELSPMARSFYNDSKRVSNARLKRELDYRLRYPTYREGLQALLPLETAVA